ncbi:MAG TPA: hypothetical protein VK063_12900 [Beutenbergiaceae bacterium]|nr:hypothetical protein [Beutenbergiaceae bacterium]
MADWWEQFPVISQRANGDRLIGHSGPFAEDLYAAGTPPAHGLDSRRPRSERVAQVRIGDRLDVDREGDRWVVRDSTGDLGWLRWRAGDDGRQHAQTGVVIRLPDRGMLAVERVVVDDEGQVVDFAGTVHPRH